MKNQLIKINSEEIEKEEEQKHYAKEIFLGAVLAALLVFIFYIIVSVGKKNAQISLMEALPLIDDIK